MSAGPSEIVPQTLPESSTSSLRLERTANVLFGLNCWLWAVMGLTVTAEERFHLVRLCIAALHVVVGTLLMTRRPMILSGRAQDIIAAVPAVVLSGLAFWHAPRCSDWGWFCQTLFAVGTVIAIAALISLARNFAILPAVRGVTTSGPYRWVRHPVYLGESLLVLACFAANPDAIAAVILIATLSAVALRIRTEERLMQSCDGETRGAYGRYCQAVPHRLVPSLW